MGREIIWNPNESISFKFEPSYRHMWIGLYWETWAVNKNDFAPWAGKIKSTTDIWIAIPFIALRIIYVR